MKKAIQIGSIAIFALMTISAADAGSWKRKRDFRGPYGGVSSFSGEGSCANGNCASRQRWTGPGGRSWSREGSSSCSNGSCSGTATWTGPKGNSWTRKRSFEWND